MSKAVLVTETSDNCMECRLNYDNCSCIVTGTRFFDKDNFDPLCNVLPDCPKRPIPENRKVLPTSQYEFGALGRSFVDGWNACIDAICGEE